MTILGIKKETFDNAKTWEGGGYPIAPAGVGIEFEIIDSKTGTVSNPDESYEYLVIDSRCYDPQGNEVKHGEFFRLSGEEENDGIAKLKTFVTALGYASYLDEDFDPDLLKGTRFTADVTHWTSKKTGKKGASLGDYSSILNTELPDSGGANEPEPSRSAPKAPRRQGGRAR